VHDQQDPVRILLPAWMPRRTAGPVRGSVHRSIDIVSPFSSYQSMTDALGRCCTAREPRPQGGVLAAQLDESTHVSRRSCHGACSQLSQVSGESWQ
jgi:hypothetical protein